ncbi:MAG: anti-sigma factor antagonist [Bacilli bacterium]|nr:anti-sigma factor antagonist [Bacilli bacterium]
MNTNIKLYEENGILIAKINGEIDNSVTKEFREEIDKKILSLNLKYLIIDFGNVSFVDSSGIGFIIGRYNLMKKEKGFIILTNINYYCEKIFKISGILRLIKSYKTLEEAIKEVSNNESYRIKI